MTFGPGRSGFRPAGTKGQGPFNALHMRCNVSGVTRPPCSSRQESQDENRQKRIGSHICDRGMAESADRGDRAGEIDIDE